MKNVVLLMLGAGIGFFAAHQFNKTAQGREFFETVGEKYVLADDARRIELYKVEGLRHALGMLIAYFPKEKIVVNVERYGNTSSGSIPLALADAQAEGRLREGALVLMTGMGAGLTWGSGLIEWTNGRK